ncbi:MAG: AIM24 family protein [Oscillospiraceae bacterium]
MHYKIEGEFSPILTVFLNKNELVCAKNGCEGWHSQGICEIHTADNIIDALKNKLSEDNLFLRKYTSSENSAEIAFLPDKTPCTIFPFEADGSCSMLLDRSAFLASTGDANLYSFISKTFGDNRFELCGISGTGTVFAEFLGNVIKRTLSEDEFLFVRAEQLAACEKSCKLETSENESGIMLKISGGDILLYTVKR